MARRRPAIPIDRWLFARVPSSHGRDHPIWDALILKREDGPEAAARADTIRLMILAQYALEMAIAAANGAPDAIYDLAVALKEQVAAAVDEFAVGVRRETQRRSREARQALQREQRRRRRDRQRQRDQERRHRDQERGR